MSRSPERVGGGPPFAQQSGGPLEGGRCLRAGPVVAKQTQCIKRLPERPAAIFVHWCPGGACPVLGAGVRAHREEHGLLVGTSEAGRGPLKTSRRGQLWAALSWKTGIVSHRKALWCHRCQGMSWTRGAACLQGGPGGRPVHRRRRPVGCEGALSDGLGSWDWEPRKVWSRGGGSEGDSGSCGRGSESITEATGRREGAGGKRWVL